MDHDPHLGIRGPGGVEALDSSMRSEIMLLWWIWGGAVTLLTMMIRPWRGFKSSKPMHGAALSSTYDCQCGSCERHL